MPIYKGSQLVAPAGFSRVYAGASLVHGEPPVVDVGYDVMLIEGQSNAYYGYGGFSAFDTEDVENIKEFASRSPNVDQVVPAIEPLDFPAYQSDRISFAKYFAKRYIDEGRLAPGRKVLIVAAAKASSGFSDDEWNPGDTGYEFAVAQTNKALALEGNNRLVAMCWHQGHEDRFMDMGDYETALDGMIAQMRADITGDNSAVPFVLGGLLPYSVDNDANMQAVETVILDTPNRVPFTGYASPRLPTLLDKPDNTVDALHFTAEHQREMGTNRYWTGFLAAEQNNGSIHANIAVTLNDDTAAATATSVQPPLAAITADIDLTLNDDTAAATATVGSPGPSLPVAGEIMRITFTAGGAQDELDAGRSITEVGTIAYPDDPELGYVADFGGTGLLQIPEPLAAGHSYTKVLVANIDDGLNAYDNLWVGNVNTGPAVFTNSVGDLIMGGHGKGFFAIESDDFFLPLGTFRHIAASYDSVAGEMRLYGDGVLLGTATGAVAGDWPTDQNLGGVNNGAQYWRGRVSIARYYDRALTLAEVQTLMAIDLPS